MTKRKHRRMYAVSKERVGIIAGTMSYSRRDAIENFIGRSATLNPHAWNNFKATGYRTVMARVEVIRAVVSTPGEQP